MSRKIRFKNNKGQGLVGILHTPQRKSQFPAVVVCHGLSSNKNSKYKKEMCRQLARLGIIGLRIDLSGHGESQGKFANVTVSQGIKDIGAAVKYLRSLKNVDQSRIGLWGNSLSGGEIPWVAVRHKSIKAVVVFAPAIDFPTIQLERWKKQRLDGWKKNGFIWYKPNIKLNYTFHQDSIKRVGYKVAPKILAATLVIQGEKDDTVPLKYVKKFFNKLRCVKKMIVIKNGRHQISKAPYEDRVVRLSVSWFKKYL